MAGTSGPLGTSGSDMVGGPCRNWGCLAGEGRTGEGRRREGGAGAGFSCCCRCRTPELSLQTLGLGQQAGPGVRPPKMSDCRSPGPLGPSSAGGAGGDQRRPGPLRGPHLTPRGISVESLRSGKEGAPASLVEPRRGLRSPKCLGADAGGAARPPGPAGGATSVVGASGSLQSPPAWHQWVSSPLSSFWFGLTASLFLGC